MTKYRSKSKRLVEVYHHLTGKGQRWFFRVKRRQNGEIICQSEGYVRKIDCIRTARLVTGGRLRISIIK